MQCIRIWFRKEGMVKYISHLDVNRCMIRAIQRSKLPVKYTEGFNPHPQITFALPLSLGMESLCESMDLKLTQELSYEAVRERLNAVLPEGFTVYRVVEPVMKPGAICSAEYDVSWKQHENAAWTAERIREILSGDSLLAIKKTKSGSNELNLIPYISRFSLEADGDKILLNLLLPAGNTTNINPALIMTALRERSQIAPDGVRILRKNLYTANGEKFS